MTKRYTHEEIEYMIQSERRLGGNGISIVRQLLEENRALDEKRAMAGNLCRQQEKRIEQLEAELQADPMAQLPPFDWGPEGESGGEPIKYAAISKDGKKMFVTQGDQIAEIDLDAATKNDPGARAYFGLDDGSESNG